MYDSLPEICQLFNPQQLKKATIITMQKTNLYVLYAYIFNEMLNIVDYMLNIYYNQFRTGGY